MPGAVWSDAGRIEPTPFDQEARQWPILHAVALTAKPPQETRVPALVSQRERPVGEEDPGQAVREPYRGGAENIGGVAVPGESRRGRRQVAF